VSLERAAPLL
jgi:amino acid-binding domain sensor hybrid histidine kinase (EC 2.7.13.3)